MSLNISLQHYTEKSLVIRGETTPIKSKMMDLGGKFGYYGGQPGWMFHISKEDTLRKAFSFPSGYSEGPQRNPVATRQEPTEFKLPDVVIQTTATRGSLRNPVAQEQNELKLPDVVIQTSGVRGGLRMRENPENTATFEMPLTFSGERCPPKSTIEMPPSKSIVEIMGMMNNALKMMTEEMKNLTVEVALLRNELKTSRSKTDVADNVTTDETVGDETVGDESDPKY